MPSPHEHPRIAFDPMMQTIIKFDISAIRVSVAQFHSRVEKCFKHLKQQKIYDVRCEIVSRD